MDNFAYKAGIIDNNGKDGDEGGKDKSVEWGVFKPELCQDNKFLMPGRDLFETCKDGPSEFRKEYDELQKSIEPMNAKELQQSAERIAATIAKRDDFGNAFKREQLTAEFQNAVQKKSLPELIDAINAQLKKTNPDLVLSGQLGALTEKTHGDWRLSGSNPYTLEHKYPIFNSTGATFSQGFEVSLKNSATGSVEDKISSSVETHLPRARILERTNPPYLLLFPKPIHH